MQAITYFLPIYFQAVRSKWSLTLGIYFLTFSQAIILTGGMTGAMMSKHSYYVPLNFLGFTQCALSADFYSLLDETSNTGVWVGYQIMVLDGSRIVSQEIFQLSSDVANIA
ncbi:hypothetical protein DE146DRAFT_788636 [Phaeosphaeria sp. MPI-PUGE-AT-0046c]|nr:hypothetical protein DE146DRAFT_788636 [Phaeosphaeria sp. MPI-PUGE-AT-0046c]